MKSHIQHFSLPNVWPPRLPQLLKKFHFCMPTVHKTRSITQMVQKNWNVMDTSRNRKHLSRSRLRWTLNWSLESLPCPTGTQKSQETLHDERIIAVRKNPITPGTLPVRCHKREKQWWVVEHGVEESGARRFCEAWPWHPTARRWGKEFGSIVSISEIVFQPLHRDTVERSSIFGQFLPGAFQWSLCCRRCGYCVSLVFVFSPCLVSLVLIWQRICVGLKHWIQVMWNWSQPCRYMHIWSLCLDTEIRVRTPHNRTSWYLPLAKTIIILRLRIFFGEPISLLGRPIQLSAEGFCGDSSCLWTIAQSFDLSLSSPLTQTQKEWKQRCLLSMSAQVFQMLVRLSTEL